MPDATHVHLRHVATHAGVSVATVSRALRGLAGVSPQSMAAVMNAVAHLGYRPDPTLSALSRYRWPDTARPGSITLAHLHDRSNAQHQDMTDGIILRAQALGYLVEHIDVAELQDATRLTERIRLKQVGGIIVNIHDDTFKIFPQPGDFPSDICGVVLGEGQRHLSLPRVSTDWALVFEDATRRLHEHGHHRIGFITRRFLGGDLTDELYTAALFCRSLDQGSASIPVMTPSAMMPQSVNQLREWLATYRPTAVIGDGAVVADALDACGAQVGTRLAYVSTIGIGITRSGLAVSGYGLDLAGRGRHGVDLVHLAFLHGESGLRTRPPRVLLPTEWQEGRTHLTKIS